MYNIKYDIMKTIKHILLTIIAAFSLLSCLPDPIDIEIEEAESKLVISSQIIPDQVMIISVSRSIGALDYSVENGGNSIELLNELLVSNAFVTVTHDDIVDTLTMIANLPGFYVSTNTVQNINSVYDLFVYDPESKDTVRSQAIMLQKVPMDSVKVTKQIDNTIEHLLVDYSFTDPVDEENWYMINFISVNNNIDTSGINPFVQEDKVLTESVIFSDKIIENGIWAFGNLPSRTAEFRTKKFCLVLSGLSCFRYLSSKETPLLGNGNSAQ